MLLIDVVHGNEVDWKKAGENALKGAAAGAIIGSGVGAVSAIATAAGVSATTVTTVTVGAAIGGTTNGVIEVGNQIHTNQEIDMGKVAISGAAPDYYSNNYIYLPFADSPLSVL